MRANVVAGVFFCSLALYLANPSIAQERREVPPFRTYGSAIDQAQSDSIDLFLKTFRIAWADQDTEALSSLHAPDTEWINAYARIFQGRTPLMEFLRETLFPGFDKEISQAESRAMDPISIRYLGGDVAVVHLYTDSGRGASRDQNEQHRRTHIHLVLSQTGAGWHIVHTGIMDAR